jgi:hypothetical protein
MTYEAKRFRRRKKTTTYQLKNGYIFKMRLMPWLRTDAGCIWLASLAVGKSKRQLNDWLNRRNKKSVRSLSASLTGQEGNKIQALAIRQVRHWVVDLPPGDSLCLRCESAVPDKQFKVWRRWFEAHEDPRWRINPDLKSFYIYKPSNLE